MKINPVEMEEEGNDGPRAVLNSTYTAWSSEEQLGDAIAQQPLPFAATKPNLNKTQDLHSNPTSDVEEIDPSSRGKAVSISRTDRERDT